MKLHHLPLLTCVACGQAIATEGYELFYREVENGIDPYISRLSVTQRYLRIDDLSEQQSSGFMLFDAENNTIYSVSHQDKSILVMKPFAYDTPALSDKLVHQDSVLPDAPTIAGKQVHHYRVALEDETISELCTSVQYVPGLLPAVGKILHAWQQVISGNQVKILDRTPEEYRTPCMLSDQVYNRGDYYAKGIVIQEWHSNGKQRVLQDYRKKQFDQSLFELPKDYMHFSLDDTRPLP